MRIPVTLALLLIIGGLGLFAGSAPAGLAVGSGRAGAIVFSDGITGHIFTMSDTGARREELTDGPNDIYPQWSPDGRRIAFQREGGEVWVMNGDGTNQRMVTTGSHPTWTPDMDLLVISSDSEIEKVSLSGTVLANLSNTPTILESFATMSPDGAMIAYISNEDPGDGDPDNNPTAGTTENIWLMDAVGANKHLLWESFSLELDVSADWAPDSSRLAFEDGGDIWTTPPDGNNQTNLTNDADFQEFAGWSPDGKEVAYAQYSAGPLSGATASQIFAINIDTRATRNLTNDPGAMDTMPHWQPWPVRNGKIAFITSTDNAFPDAVSIQGDTSFMGVAFMDADGTHRRYQLDTSGNSDPSFQLGRPAWSPDGTKLAVDFTTGTAIVDAQGHFTQGAVDGASPSWFPDSRILLVSKDGDLQTVDTTQNPSSPTPLLVTGNNVQESEGAVSPDGNWIVYTSNESPGDDPANPTTIPTHNLWLLDPTSLDRTPIVQSATYQGYPAWSPDGKRVTYGDAGDIWTVDPFNPIDRVNLTNDALLQGAPSWSPDGRLIIFTQGPATFGSSQIWTIDVTTKQRTRLTLDPDNQRDSFGVWQPHFAPGSTDYFPWGDNLCSGRPGGDDALAIVTHLAGLDTPHVPGCPWLGESGLTSTNATTEWGNVDCTAGLNAADVLVELAYVAEVNYTQFVTPVGGPNDTCPLPNDYVQWIPLGPPN